MGVVLDEERGPCEDPLGDAECDPAKGGLKCNISMSGLPGTGGRVRQQSCSAFANDRSSSLDLLESIIT